MPIVGALDGKEIATGRVKKKRTLKWALIQNTRQVINRQLCSRIKTNI